MPNVSKRPLSPGELSLNAKKLKDYKAKPQATKAANSKHPDGIFLRSKDVWGNSSSTVNDIRKEF